jgi:alpha-1,3-rhamnosyl/mannosyltransferase
MIRVGVNLLYLKPGRVGGSEEYLLRLVHALEDEAADDVDLTLFVNRRFRVAHPDVARAHRLVEAPISGDWPPLRIAAESTWLARQAARRPLDLVHHVANTIPQVRTRRAVVSIHDLQPIVRPHDMGRMKRAYLRRRLAPAARRSAVVATLSDYVRGLVIERFAVDPDRVVVVPAPVSTGRPAPLGQATGAGADIDGPFFVYAAITHPHKNHLTLVRALARLSESRPEVSLVLTGGAGEREGRLREEIARLGVGDRVRRLGRIPRPDLDALLGRAVALTFPSRHEGYGLPVAEAMALGCPVIASDVTALPEVVGEAGILVDPDDPEAWAAAMMDLLDDGPRRAALAEAGRRRVESLTPAHTARRMVDAYRRASELM